jgi:hypothetical protein
MALIMDSCYKRKISIEDEPLSKKQFDKKAEKGQSMKQNYNDKAEKVKEEVKRKGEEVLKWVIAIIYLILLSYFVFKPLTEFMVMVEYNIKVGILNYFIK